MADNDLLAQAQSIQQQKLLAQAQSIQQAKTAEANPIGIGQAALIKAEEGSQLGLRPVVAGIGSAIGNAAAQASGPSDFNFGQVKDAFSSGRNDAIEEQKQAQAQHPTVSTAAKIGGSLLTTPFVGAKGLAASTGLGAGLGAAEAAGSAQSVPEAAFDVGLGALGGVGGYGLAKGAGAALTGRLESFAQTKAFKAAGGMLKDFRAAFNNNPEKINQLGSTMLDNGLLQVGDDVKSIAQKSETLRRQTGKQIGEVYEKVLDTLTNPESEIPHDIKLAVQEAGFHPEAQADQMKALVAQKFKGQPGSTGAINKAHQVIDELAMNGNNITPDHALELKGNIDSMINWSKKSQDLPLEQDALKEVRGYIQTRLNNQVNALDQVLQNPQSKELSRLNSLYGNVSTIANISRDRALRETANQSFSLGDKVMAGAGAAMAAGVGHEHSLAAIVGAAGLAGANMAARKYGNAAAAAGASSLAQGVASPANYMPAISQAMNGRAPFASGNNQTPNLMITPGELDLDSSSNARYREPPKMSTTIRSRSGLGK